MNAKFIAMNPVRRPQWRFDRVMQLVRHRPRPLWPRWEDCHAIRAYRYILLELAAARHDEDALDQIMHEYPEICHAHAVHYSADAEPRQILEARLLTTESLDLIAKRMGTSSKAIEYYEALFFNVRDRLDCDVWIRSVIRGNFSMAGDNGNNGMGVEQRGYVLRLFAYYGGPLVLDAVIQGLSHAKMPSRTGDVEPWFEDVLGQLVRTSAAVAAATIAIDRKNIMRLLTLAMKHRTAVEPGSETAASDLQNRLKTMLDSVNVAISGGARR